MKLLISLVCSLLTLAGCDAANKQAKLPTTLTPLKKLEGYPRAISNNSKLLAVAAKDKVVVYDLVTGKAVFTEADDFVLFSKDSTRVMVETKEKRLKVYDIASHKQLADVKGDVKSISSNAQLFAIASNGQIKIYDAMQQKDLFQVAGDANSPLSFDPNGATFAVTLPNSKAESSDPWSANVTKLYEIPSGKELMSLEGSFAAFSGDASMLAVSSRTHGRVYHITSGKKLLGFQGSQVTLSADAKKVLVDFAVYDIQSGKKLIDVAATDEWRSLQTWLSPDGSLLAALQVPLNANLLQSSAPMITSVFDIASGKKLMDIKAIFLFFMGTSTEKEPLLIAGIPDGEKKLKIADIASGKLLVDLAIEGPVLISNDNTLLIVPSSDDQSYVYDVRSLYDSATKRSKTTEKAKATPSNAVAPKSLLSTLPKQKTSVPLGRTSEDGKFVASEITANNTPKVHVTDRGSGKEQLVAEGHISGDPFSPNSKLITLYVDNLSKIYDIASGKELLSIPREMYDTLSFNSLSTKALVEHAYKEIQVYDIASGKKLLVLPGGYYSTFSPDSKFVASTTQEGKVGIYDATSGKELFTQEHGQAYFSPNSQLCVITTPDDQFKVLKVPLWTEVFKGSGRWVQISPNSKLLAMVDEKGNAQVYDLATSKNVFTIEKPGNPVIFSPDSRFVAVSSPTDAGFQAIVYDIASKKRTASVKGWLGDMIGKNPEQKTTMFVVGNTIYDIASGKEIVTFPGKVASVQNNKVITSEDVDEKPEFFLYDISGLYTK